MSKYIPSNGLNQVIVPESYTNHKRYNDKVSESNEQGNRLDLAPASVKRDILSSPKQSA